MKTLPKHIIFFLVLVLQVLTVCETQADTPEYSDYWTTDSAWYKAKDTISSDKIDLFYLVSTDVVSATDASGNNVYRAQLTPMTDKLLVQNWPMWKRT